MKLTAALAASLVLGLLTSSPAAARDRHDHMRGHHSHCHWVMRHHHRVKVCR